MIHRTFEAIMFPKYSERFLDEQLVAEAAISSNYKRTEAQMAAYVQQELYTFL
eukprot:IDg13043t1